MKKRLLALLMALAMVFALAACSNSDDQASDSPSGSGAPSSQTGGETGGETGAGIAKEDLKIGFVHIGDESDRGYTYNMVMGTNEMVEALGISEDQLVVKYNIPETDACADAIYEGRYLAGIVAGLKAKEIGNPHLGYVGAFPYAEVISGYTAFYLGAKSVYPEVTMDVIYTNEWNHADKEAKAAQSLIDRGCGVISQHSDSTSPATTAEQNGAFQVGYNADMTDAAPGASLISPRIDWGPYFTYAVQCMMDGTAIDTDWTAGWAEGSVVLTDLNTAIAAEGTQEALDEAEAALTDGSLQVFAGPLKGTNANGDTLELAEGESFVESDVAGGKTSAPYFDYIVEGITVVE